MSSLRALFTPRRTAIALGIASAIGYAIAFDLFALLYLTQQDRIFDSTLYWRAARSVLDGATPYGAIAIGTTDKAFFYAPIFAQLSAPIALLPEPIFTWAWRLFSFASLVWLAGGWRNAGLWLLVPFTLAELANPNVTLPAAAATLLALRGWPWLLPMVGLVKFGPLLLVPYVWLRKPNARRALVIACAATAGLCAASFALAPQMWFDFVGQMRAQNAVTTSGGVGLIAIMPTAGADFAVRAGLGALLVAAGIWLRSDRLAYIAAVIVVPAFWLTRLVPLLALPRVRGRESRRDRATDERSHAEAEPQRISAGAS